MQQKKEFSEYLFFYVRKLWLPVTIITALHLIIIFLITTFWPKMYFIIPVSVAIFPVVCFLLFYVSNKAKGNLAHILSHCKYNTILPFYFHYDANPVKNERIDIKSIKEIIQPADILLRRYTGYIDEFIFAENSYFTHVGIYVDECEGLSSQVLHCNAQCGVHATSLDEFCDGDDIAIFRFSFDKSPEEEKMCGYITNKKCRTEEEKKIQEQEELFFSKLMQKAKPEPPYNSKEDTGGVAEYYPVIIEQAKSLIHKPYDLQFNFEEFNTFSCIEYVWYCFKCVFPLHRIRVKDFEFFLLEKIPIIIPDVFIRNDFFAYIYSSAPGVNSKKQLMEYIKQGRWPLVKFLFMVFLWDIFFLVVCSFL